VGEATFVEYLALQHLPDDVKNPGGNTPCLKCVDDVPVGQTVEARANISFYYPLTTTFAA
jgi:hypothetical protein